MQDALIAGEQSSRNWGWVRQMGRDPLELPLAIESLTLWRTMNARIGEETGRLEEMLQEVADIYDQEVQRALERLLAAIDEQLALSGVERGENVGH